MMRRSQAEKIEIIHLVEHSELSISRTLDELDVPRSTFYRWYQRYQEEGLDGVANLKPRKMRFGISEGMLLAASGEKDLGLQLVHPDDEAWGGWTVS